MLVGALLANELLCYARTGPRSEVQFSITDTENEKYWEWDDGPAPPPPQRRMAPPVAPAKLSPLAKYRQARTQEAKKLSGAGVPAAKASIKPPQ
jgi:hypothetical protein